MVSGACSSFVRLKLMLHRLKPDGIFAACSFLLRKTWNRAWTHCRQDLNDPPTVPWVGFESVSELLLSIDVPPMNRWAIVKRPLGTPEMRSPLPADESVGYCRSLLRDDGTLGLPKV
jgi:hypothetical protein